MTANQVVANATALRNLAENLTGLGYTGDDVHEVAEHLAMNLLADGYRKVERNPSLRPARVASGEHRQRALAEARAAVEAKRGNRPELPPSCGAEYHPDDATTVYCRQPAGHGGDHHSVDGQDVWS